MHHFKKMRRAKMWKVHERIEDVYESAIERMLSILYDVCEQDFSDSEIALSAREYHRLRDFHHVSKMWRGVVKWDQDEEIDAILRARRL
jgi:hypothetical protein